MAFPQVAAANGGVDNTDRAIGANYAVNLPAGIVAGNLLLIIITVRPDSSAATIRLNFPAGWNECYYVKAGGLYVGIQAEYRIADGAEGASINATVANENCLGVAYVTYRITGYSGIPLGSALAIGGTDSTPDPPDLAPGWGAKDILWIAVHGSTKNVTVWPAGFGNTVEQAGDAVCSCCRLELNAASKNPGTFTISAATRWCAATLGVQPAGAATVTPKPSAAAKFIMAGG